MCDADGRATTGPVYCAGVFQCFGDIGINHPPMNSGVISLNSPWLPLHIYIRSCPINVIANTSHPLRRAYQFMGRQYVILALKNYASYIGRTFI